MQGLRIRTGRSIHEMRTSQIFDGKGLDSHAEQKYAVQSRAKTVLFLELSIKMSDNHRV